MTPLNPTTPLRQRMIEDMQIRNLAVNTQTTYVEQVARFAGYFHASPDKLGPDDQRQLESLPDDN